MQKATNPDTAFIDGELYSILRIRGFSISYGKPEAVDLRVECLFRRTIGCPSLGRHFSVEIRHISFVNVKVIESQSNEIIGEVECTRSWFGKLPPNFVRLIIDRLWSPTIAGGDAGTHYIR
jgi:hypothetical protein